MVYPRWFPSPGAWFRAVVLFVALTPLIFMARVFNYSISEASGFESFIWLVVIPLIFLAFLNQGIEENSFDFPSIGSWIDGFWSWLACAVALLICTIAEYIRYNGYVNLATVLGSDCENYLKIIFLVVLAYFYQARYLFLNRKN
ncbi:hypothetical protein [Gloeothece verrucosa]|uniref:Uncharacterized protein n=1 Tax=Gloeothece verrucosa (strain PCC 7822) TaxID=497965 RepID=E0UAG3_GLOV7|nr:hypothetical protein [Gloeothece verrucosa]ADN12704.1 hypothetical protein Cyan7822_0668 [Gloeothece verrucosa PCC 7822]